MINIQLILFTAMHVRDIHFEGWSIAVEIGILRLSSLNIQRHVPRCPNHLDRLALNFVNTTSYCFKANENDENIFLLPSNRPPKAALAPSPALSVKFKG